MRWLILAAVLALPGIAQAQLLEALGVGDGRPPSVLLSKYVWSGDVGTPTWVGLGTPSIDCVADASGGTITCSGATMTPTGSPTTVSTNYRLGGVDQTAVKLGANPDSFTAATPSASQTHTGCAIVKLNTAYVGALVTFGSGTTLFYDGGPNLQAFVYRASDNTPTYFSVGPIAVGQSDVICSSYQYVADGSSVVRVNRNGVVYTNSAAVGPIKALGPAIGQSGARISVARYSEWVTSAGSATQLSVAVKAMQNAYAVKPADYSASATLTTTQAGAVMTPNAAGTAIYKTPANVASITPTVGLNVYGANTNSALYSEAFDNAAWVPETDQDAASAWSAITVYAAGDFVSSASVIYKSLQGTNVANAVSDAAWWIRYTPTVTAGTADGPDFTALTADSILLPATSGGSGQVRVCQAINATAAKWAYSHFARVASGSALTYLYVYRGGTGYNKSCTLSTSWQRCGDVTTANLDTNAWKICIGHGGVLNPAAATVLAFGAQFEAGAAISPYISTAVSAANRAAQGESVPWAQVLGPWNVAISALPSGGWATGVAKGLWSTAASGSDRANLATAADNTLVLTIVDHGAGVQTWTSAALSGTTAKTIVVASNNAGAVALTVDGVATAFTATGAGTGILGVVPTTLTLGAHSTTYLNGSIARVSQCSGISPASCSSANLK